MKHLILLTLSFCNVLHSEESIFEKIQINTGFSPLEKNNSNRISSLTEASEHLKDLPKPWTVDHFIELHNDPKYESKRPDILMLLIASGDERGKELFGRYVEKIINDGDRTGIAFFGPLMNAACFFYIPEDTGGGTEQAAIAVAAWWKEYKKIKQDLVREKWQIAWENTENKDKLPVESVKAIATQLAGDDLEKTNKSIAELKAQGAVNSLMVLLEYPNDPVVKAAAESLAEFPTKEVATALFRSLKNFDTALAGGTNGTAAQDQAILAVTTSLFRITQIEPTPEFADQEKRNSTIEKAITEMLPLK